MKTIKVTSANGVPDKANIAIWLTEGSIVRHIEVLGFECAACRKTYALVNETAHTLGLSVRVEKVNDPVRIATYRIHDAPAIAVDGLVVYSGGIPPRWQIEVWLTIPWFKKLTA